MVIIPRTLLVQMMSAAGTGFCFNTKRGRLREKLVIRKHDPFGKHGIINQSMQCGRTPMSVS